MTVFKLRDEVNYVGPNLSQKKFHTGCIIMLDGTTALVSFEYGESHWCEIENLVLTQSTLNLGDKEDCI